MPTITWPADPIEATRRLGRFDHPGESQALAVHACWTTESLWYLHDIDGPTQAQFPAPINGEHDAHMVDITHVRWAAGSAITALDLCAASLGVAFCGDAPDEHAASVRHFNPSDERTRRRAERYRARLPVEFLAWVDAVLADPRYEQMRAARNPMTHKRLKRHLHMPAERTKFEIGGSPVAEPATFPLTSEQWARRREREEGIVSAPELIRMARDLASDHCVGFMTELLRLPP